MKLSFTLPLVFGASLFFSGCTLFVHPVGGIKITSNVTSDVFLDGKKSGVTPFTKDPLDTKRYTLKLVPSDGKAPYETTLKVGANVQTTLDWTFGATPEANSGLQFDVENAKSASSAELEFVTIPDTIPITIDGTVKGFSPLVVTDLAEGEHQIKFQAPGYDPLATGINLVKGKRMVLRATLAKRPVVMDASASASLLVPTPLPSVLVIKTAIPKLVASASAAPITIPKPYILVLDTPTGFLRVRNAPVADATEVTRILSGVALPYAGETTNGWFSVKYSKIATSSGWVSATYSQLVK